MPLNENEQQLLAEIERHLHQSDPRLAREVGQTTVYGHALGSLRWSVVGLVVGLVVMVATLRIHYLVAFVGFVIMFASGLGLERNFRMMGRAGIQQVSSAIRGVGPAQQDETESEET